jgi:hypothetical protein
MLMDQTMIKADRVDPAGVKYQHVKWIKREKSNTG